MTYKSSKVVWELHRRSLMTLPTESSDGSGHRLVEDRSPTTSSERQESRPGLGWSNFAGQRKAGRQMHAVRVGKVAMALPSSRVHGVLDLGRSTKTAHRWSIRAVLRRSNALIQRDGLFAATLQALNGEQGAAASLTHTHDGSFSLQKWAYRHVSGQPVRADFFLIAFEWIDEQRTGSSGARVRRRLSNGRGPKTRADVQWAW